MTRSAALPYFLRRSHDVVERGTFSSTAESVDGLPRLDRHTLVIQWRVTRNTEHDGSSIRSDQGAEPVREVCPPDLVLALADRALKALGEGEGGPDE